jgi:hypothetical protein
MRTLVLGDTHGHTTWKKVMDKEAFDKVVMLGDYVDSFTIEPKKIADNLLDIINTKEVLKDKMVLIYGNHDHSYYYGEKCSGWNIVGQHMYCPLLQDMMNENMFELIHIQDDILLSHAGVSTYWLTKVVGLSDVKDATIEYLKGLPLEFDALNWNMLTGYNGYGDTISQSPIWIRPHSLLKDKLDGYRQIVGHTHFRTPVEQGGIWFNDMMPHHYIVIEDNEIKFVENKD